MIGLRKLGILGLNERNIALINRLNPRRALPKVDDKIQTKILCRNAGIPIPQALALARSHFELGAMAARLDSLRDFVMKPARGTMGNGIVVVAGVERGGFRKPSGSMLSRSKLLHHASSILSGLYALGGQPDRVLVEERLRVHEDLARVSHEGVPDVRVIVYRGFPVMAMARLPTKSSDGRANLHQGAVGLGVDIARGTSLFAIRNNRSIREHPDTRVELTGFRIPSFDQILDMSLAAADETGLGYLGADIVVDGVEGPLVLELNARPGLSVQICNQGGLIHRFEDVDRVVDTVVERRDRISWAKDRAAWWRTS